MNLNNILLHLEEAKEELEKIISEIKNNTEYDEVEFYIRMQHLYNHINTAWNTRNIAKNRLNKISEKDFYELRKMPQDIDMSNLS